MSSFRLSAAWRRSIVIACSLVLTACSLTPEYRRPDAPVPQQFPGAADAGVTGLPAWQGYYTDPALRQLIETALNHNRNLRIAVARIDEARGLLGVARADRLPAVNAQVSENVTRTPPDVLATPTARSISRRFDAGLAIPSFELDFWGRVAALTEVAKAQYLSTEEATRSFRVSLIGDVAAAWFQLSEFAGRERLISDTLRNREDSLQLLRQRRDAGLAGDLDVLTAESLVASLRVQRADLQRQRQQTANALRLLTGSTLPLPSPVDTAALPVLISLAPGLPSGVLLRRPDVLAAEQRLIAANANIGVARAAFFPRLALTTSYGSASRALSGLFDAGSHAWAFQPVLTVPLFSAGRAEANLDVAQARKQQAVADYERSIQQAFSEVADALSARAAYADQLAAQRDTLNALRRRHEQVSAREAAGVANYLEVLDAQRDLIAAEQTAVTLRRQVLAAGAVLYRALGGGADAVTPVAAAAATVKP